MRVHENVVHELKVHQFIHKHSRHQESVLLLNNKYMRDTKGREYALSHYKDGRCLINGFRGRTIQVYITWRSANDVQQCGCM